MALTHFQERICRLIAAQRIRSGQSYIAGGAALGLALESARLSRDVDVFHDSGEALRASWEQDRVTLEAAGIAIEATRQLPTYVEAVASEGDDSVLLQWTLDSAFRFFPLVEHPIFGLALHPFDLATNKVLALVGRLEVRDWLDVMQCHRKLQPLGLLVWAACGKDPGFNPASLLAEARRSSHYTAADLEQVEFAEPPPEIGLLSREWKQMLAEAEGMAALLPSEYLGQAAVNIHAELFQGNAESLAAAIANGELRFHSGAPRGAWPAMRSLLPDSAE